MESTQLSVPNQILPLETAEYLVSSGEAMKAPMIEAGARLIMTSRTVTNFSME